MLSSDCIERGQHLEGLQGCRRGVNARAVPPSLWIACTDLVMNQTLGQIQQMQSVIILRRFGHGFSQRISDSFELVCDVASTVKSQGIRDIVICGHSMCSSMPASEGQSLPCSGFDDLLQRIRHREATNRRGRDKVRRQVKLWKSIPSMKRDIVSGELTIHGLFYLAESGVFTRYDEPTHQFVASMQCDGPMNPN